MVDMISCCRIALNLMLEERTITIDEYNRMSHSETITMFDELQYFSLRERSIIQLMKYRLADPGFIDILKDKARNVDGLFYELWVKYLTKYMYENDLSHEDFSKYLIVEYFYDNKLSDREIEIYEYLMANIEIELLANNPENIKYIDNQTTEMQIEILEAAPNAVEYMDNLSFETLMYINKL